MFGLRSSQPDSWHEQCVDGGCRGPASSWASYIVALPAERPVSGRFDPRWPCGDAAGIGRRHVSAMLSARRQRRGRPLCRRLSHRLWTPAGLRPGRLVCVHPPPRCSPWCSPWCSPGGSAGPLCSPGRPEASAGLSWVCRSPVHQPARRFDRRATGPITNRVRFSMWAVDVGPWLSRPIVGSPVPWCLSRPPATFRTRKASQHRRCLWDPRGSGGKSVGLGSAAPVLARIGHPCCRCPPDAPHFVKLPRTSSSWAGTPSSCPWASWSPGEHQGWPGCRLRVSPRSPGTDRPRSPEPCRRMGTDQTAGPPAACRLGTTAHGRR